MAYAVDEDEAMFAQPPPPPPPPPARHENGWGSAADGRATLDSASAGANSDLVTARADAGAAGLRMAARILATNAGNNNALYLRAHALKLLGRVEEAAEARQVDVAPTPTPTPRPSPPLFVRGTTDDDAVVCSC